MTTSGKEGRLTVPFDTSLARLPRKASADAFSSAVVAALFGVAEAIRWPAGDDATFVMSNHC
jgi:hypothetical protein